MTRNHEIKKIAYVYIDIWADNDSHTCDRNLNSPCDAGDRCEPCSLIHVALEMLMEIDDPRVRIYK